MNHSIPVKRVSLYFLMFLALAVHGALGQAARPVRRGTARDTGQRTADKAVLKIRKLEGLGKRSLIGTPEYRTSVSRSSKTPGEWLRVRVTYDTYPEWIDELTFQYYVLTLKTERGKRAYSLFKARVGYVDIEEGRGHMSTVFLRPSTLKKYGTQAGVAVEISHGGKVVAEESDEESSAKLPEDWWKKSNVVESQAVTVRNGYLLDRSKSPFALINIDDHEIIKQ